jgi:hypothetical protein
MPKTDSDESKQSHQNCTGSTIIDMYNTSYHGDARDDVSMQHKMQEMM